MNLTVVTLRLTLHVIASIRQHFWAFFMFDFLQDGWYFVVLLPVSDIIQKMQVPPQIAVNQPRKQH